jgi:crotonobetainyl-CoA:carnitine CoA-transferase CaiB-like acyl-CoA transferase
LNPPSLRSAAPILGEHTEEILKTISVNQEEYKALQKEGIIL